MICVVVGAGRSGTNLVLEMMRGNSYFTLTDMIEDKSLFTRDCFYRQRLVVKCDLWYCRSYEFWKRLMINNVALKILFTIRHPYDMCLSKLYRGRDGADDATISGCIADMYHMFALYERANKDFPKRILLVRMESVILDIEKEAKRICDWLPLPYEKDMKFPHRHMRDPEKKKRYSTLDKSQIGMWRDWESVYDGFFAKNQIDVKYLFDMVKPIARFFNYEIGKI